jgi:hypothetical protein
LRRWVIAALLALGAVGWGARLFTAKIAYQDASTGVVWRATPSCERKLRVSGSDAPRVNVVHEEDGSFAGEWIYDWLVEWATVIGPAGALAAALYHRRALRGGLRRKK